MLNPEQAQAELEKLKNPQWAATRHQALGALPGELHQTARTILGTHDHSIPKFNGTNAQRQLELTKTFKAMDEKARLLFFEAMAPGLSSLIERGWQMFDRLPYQSGHARKPFRAPGHPDALIIRRINWLIFLLGSIGPYQQNITWFAAWAPYVTRYGAADQLGILLAAAIDAGGSEGEEVFQILCASARNEHPVGGMGRHVTRGLLCAERPDGWQFIENMLLAAQREEGLRQVILETVDEAHPQAFRRMLKVILDHNLARFSATVRAFDVWLGYQWDAVSTGVVESTIEKMLLYLEDKAARETALKGMEPEQAYLALWSHAFDDAVTVVPVATELFKHAEAGHRFVAAHLLNQLGLVASQRSLLIPLEDADLRVATRALTGFQRSADPRVKKADLFERLEKLLPRFPDKPEKLKEIVWPWTACTISKEMVADALPHCLGERPPARLIPHLDNMGTHGRAQVIGLLAGQEKWDAGVRDTLFALLGDASRSVREAALQHISKCKLTPAEAEGMEKLLERKTGDLRRGVLTLLHRQKDADALTSADRLLAARSQPQRLAGLELLRLLVEQKRSVATARASAQAFVTTHPKLNETEQQQLNTILADRETEAPVLDNALGLIRHEDRTWPSAPIPRDVSLHSPVSAKIIKALEQILTDNAQQIVSCKNQAGEMWTGLLSDLNHGFPNPNPKVPLAEDLEHLPLAETWKNWLQSRGAELRDADGMELLRTLAWYHFSSPRYVLNDELSKRYPEAIKLIFGDDIKPNSEKPWRIRNVLGWLLRLQPTAGGVEFALDAAESSLALVSRDALHLSPEETTRLKELADAAKRGGPNYWRHLSARAEIINNKDRWRKADSPYATWLQVLKELGNYAPELWNRDTHIKHWKLLRWLDQPVRPREHGGDSGISLESCLPRERSDIMSLSLAHGENGSSEADIVEQILGQNEAYHHGYGRHNFSDLNRLSTRKRRAGFEQLGFLFPLMERCRKRILEIELTRGDTPTPASGPALSLSCVEGTTNLAAILRALGKRNFARGWTRDNLSMETVLSHLARCSFPLAGETAADFSRQVKTSGIIEDRLVELAVYAPQWAEFASHALGWPMLTEAVWWIHAHTKGTDWTVDHEIRELWQADMNSRTSLGTADLLEGAVDVAWFHRIHQALGSKKWEAIYEAARYASTGAGHARARLFADAMLGDVSKRELTGRITQKRHQDAVRALGLLPLAAGKKREADLLERYKVIQEFRRGSKQFGSQRQASEKRAAQIGQQNLARTAGFADPIRLEWAMEAKAVEDLADGPIEVLVEGVKLSLGIDPWGEIELSVTKDGKSLADIPAKLKKDPKIAALRARKVELKRQASRIRRLWNNSWCAATNFPARNCVN